MSGHSAHHRHPNYSPDQVLFDGCATCAERSRNLALALNHMDTPTFTRAWLRAAALAEPGLPDASDAELPLLAALAAVQRQAAITGGVALLVGAQLSTETT